MQLIALAIGTRMPGWVNEGVSAYTRRLPRHLELKFQELQPAQRSAGSNVARQKSLEGERILKAIQPPAYCIALDERGTARSSADLGRQLEDWLGNHARVYFMIGGADGLAQTCTERADQIWSLSKLTLPHALVRVVLAEQIYRAWTLLQGHPYHRD